MRWESEEEARLWLALHTRAANYRLLLQHFGSALAVLNAPPKTLAAVILPKKADELCVARSKTALRALGERLEKVDAYAFLLDEPDYPRRLLHLHNPPTVLFAYGEGSREQAITALNPPRMLCVVGARRNSLYGDAMTHKLVEPLAAMGVVILSGLAEGIDGVAHQACLDKNGLTIAAVAGGIDLIYPASNSRLRERIIRDGWLIGTHLPQSPALSKHFQPRNEMMAALAHAVLVVEGGQRSGTRLTANAALELGTEVFAVPSNADSIVSVVPNELLRDGAAMATRAADICAVMKWETPLEGKTSENTASAGAVKNKSVRVVQDVSLPEKKMIEILAKGPATLEIFEYHTGFAINDILMLLTTMEMREIIKQLPGQQWTLI